MTLRADSVLRVRDVCGIESLDAQIAHGRVTEIVGRNAAGKTSAALCLMAIAAREPNPAAGVAATSARRVYVRDGADPDQATATLTVSADTLCWRPAAATVEDSGQQRVSSPAAVGLVDWAAQRSARDRAALLQSVLMPDPEAMIEDVRKVLVDVMSEEDAAGAIGEVRKRGWEAAERIYRDRARDAKREWNRLTHRVYGAKVADDWRPDGWSADMDGMSVIDAESALAAARDALAATHAVRTITAEQRDAARTAAEKLPSSQADLERADQELRDARADAGVVRDRHEDTRQQIAQHERIVEAVRAMDANPQRCPSCDCALIVTAQRQIAPATLATDEDRARAADARTKVGSLRMAMDREIRAYEEAVETAQATLLEARIRLGRLLEIAGDADTPLPDEVADQQAVSDAEAAVERARDQLAMVQAMHGAQRAHQTTVRYLAAADAVGPRGPRARMVDAALKRLRAGLRVIADTAKWPQTSIDEQGAIEVDGRPVALCSESEQWRAQAAMQLTVAAMDGSGLVVLDRADLLDGTNRLGLGAALTRVCEKTGLTVVVCATGEPTIEGGVTL